MSVLGIALFFTVSFVFKAVSIPQLVARYVSTGANKRVVIESARLVCMIEYCVAAGAWIVVIDFLSSH